MKDDSIAQLSDQPLSISTRLQELERKQASKQSNIILGIWSNN